MSIWMLLIYAACMMAALFTFGPAATVASWTPVFFALTLAMFVAGLMTKGIRRPVV